ncbi:MAG: Ig-like domain repeat protein, partial [Candidatus Saganbacteria bacterium]|nr:Ig-like domain repeat protein [Candidatus Saganbacteria bacterium]
MLIHGISNDAGFFSGATGYGDLKTYLENDLGLQGRVFAYSFSNYRGDNFQLARELGDRDHSNSAPEMSGGSWLEQARVDFKKGYARTHDPWRDENKWDQVPDSVTPSKYILITHSMGNFAARAYVYSEQLYEGGGFYEDDVAKVVFIAPPFLGSDMTIMAYRMGWKGIKGGWEQTKSGWEQAKSGYGAISDYLKGDRSISLSFSVADFFSFSGEDPDLMKGIYEAVVYGNCNPYYPYFAVLDLAATGITEPRKVQILTDEYQKVCEGETFYYTSQALIDLFPYSNVVTKLKNVEPLSPDREPAYSIVYGRGVPVFDFISTFPTEGMKWMNEATAQDKFAEEAAIRGSDYFDPSGRTYETLFNQLLSLGYQTLTFFHPGFYGIDSSEGKLLSLLFAKKGGAYFTHDGDGLVPVYSAKGEGVKHLEGATKYSHTFKTQSFEDYLNNELPVHIALTEAFIYATAAFTGTPPNLFWYMRIPVCTEFIVTVSSNYGNINEDIEAHGGIMEQTDLITTAILDTPAIFTIHDLQTSKEAEVEEVSGLMSFSVSSPEAGFRSIKVQSLTEDRNCSGTINMPVPSTLDEDRKYITAITVTEAPQKIMGKLNYLIPALMKQFEYSFNFAAWKPIENVDPETGEFILENLPFAEGQNVIAVRGINAADVSSNQQLKIILNTIPMVASEISPLSGSYTNDNTPTFSGKFGKAAYSEDPLEDISLAYAKLMVGSEEVDVTSKISATIGGETYDKYLWFEYTPEEALPDGEYSLVVGVDSNVGASQATINVIIDIVAPTIAMDELQPYSARAPTTIRYLVSDEASPNLVSVSCDLYDPSDNFVTNIATSDVLSLGENLFTFDPLANGEQLPADGSYGIKIEVYDLAGNYTVAEQPITIDSTAPTITGVDITPQPMTSNTTELGLSTRADEESTILIYLYNLSTNTTTSYIAQAIAAEGGNGYLASYNWKYDEAFSSAPEDGTYRIEVVAQDTAGNQSVPATMESVRIDRTAPVIFGQMTTPYVLSNSGLNAYKTTLSFDVSESDDTADNQKGEIEITVKLYNSSSGEMLDKWVLTDERSLEFNASDAEKYPKGAYSFQIAAEDDIGNVGVVSCSCVKDGIAPVISYPVEDGAEVSGIISIRGTAIDPDWTNNLPFKQYSLYYKKGNHSPTVNPGSDWQTDAIEVSMVNRGNSSTPKNTSLRSLQNDSTLAYFQSNLLENGEEYTLLIVVEEEGGESLAAARVVKVNSDDMALSSVQNPYIQLKSLPAEIEFSSDDSAVLPIEFLNSVKPANVYVEILKPGSLNALEPVYYKYFPNVAGAPFVGEPQYQAGADLGYFIWYDEDGWHIRWSSDANSHEFSGSVVLVGSDDYSDIKQYGSGITLQSPIISWDTTISGSEGGLDFKVDSGQLMITAKIDEDPDNPSIYASNVYLGVSKYTQAYLPVMIDIDGQKLVDFAGGQGGDETEDYEASSQSLSWDGKLDSGAYVDDGTYIVRVRAEGADGIGMATDEATVNVSTPYDFAITSVSPSDREFSTISVPDSVSVYYTVSKDSIINAVVYAASGTAVSSIVSGEEVLGVDSGNPYCLTWQGNYPDPESGLLVDPGAYKIIVTAQTKDGSQSREETIDGITVASFSTDSTLVSLDPIGEEVDFYDGALTQKIRLAEGDSPFYFEAEGHGTYYPPRGFSYTLTANGTQKITAYPYVPFAALMHRGFREVDTKVKLNFRINAWNWEQGKFEDIVFFGCKVGEWYNPLAWDIRQKTVYEE